MENPVHMRIARVTRLEKDARGRDSVAAEAHRPPKGVTKG